MGRIEDPFVPLQPDDSGEAESLPRAGTTSLSDSCGPAPAAFATGRFHGFDLDDRPLVSGLAEVPGEIVAARTTVRMARAMAGAGVVVAYDGGDSRRPIIVGVLQDTVRAMPAEPARPAQKLAIEADDERLVVTAEREIVLRCGDASITLTRAGKVIIKGTYVLSRSSGYNKIKGAAVDIN
jgi:hypothetical protein